MADSSTTQAHEGGSVVVKEVPVIKEVIKEVRVEVPKIVHVPVEVIKEIPIEIIKYVDREVSSAAFSLLDSIELNLGSFSSSSRSMTLQKFAQCLWDWSMARTSHFSSPAW